MSAKLPEAIREKLADALIRDDAETLSAMLATGEGGLTVHHKASDMPSLIVFAIWRDAFRCVELLAASGKSVSERIITSSGEEHRDRTALNYALSMGKLEAADLLLRLGAKARLPDSQGNTPLHMLTKSSLSLSMKDHQITVEELKSMAIALVKAGCPINQQNDNGDTPLMSAIEVRAPLELIEVLLKLGADANVANSKGECALHFEITESHLDLVRLLAHFRADINCRSRQGMTPLHYAKDVAAIDELIALGGDIHAVDNEGRDVFHRVVADPWKKTAPEAVLVHLLDHGANPRTPDFADQSALQMLEREYAVDVPLRSTALTAIAASDARMVMRAAAGRRASSAQP